MTPDEIRAINEDRLMSWAALLTRHHAAAVLLVAVGHDHENGTIRVVVSDSDAIKSREVEILLRGALKLHREGKAEFA